MNNVLIILGMHRSGTSLVSGWLHHCGLNLGTRLAGQSPSNPRGFFEDLDFLDLHQNILSYFDIDKRGLIPPFNFKLTDHHYTQLQELVHRKELNAYEWGWKEPKTCLFINHYKSILPNARYLIVFRDYHFVVESLIRREIIGLKREYGRLSIEEQKNQMDFFEKKGEKILSLINTYLRTWIIYNQCIYEHLISINSVDFVVIRYNDLIENDDMIFQGLKAWGFKLTYYPFNNFFSSYLINEDLPEIVFQPEIEEVAIDITSKIERFMGI